MSGASIAAWGLLALAALVALVTGLSELRSPLWWIRIWDFPRAQVAVLAALLLVPVLLYGGERKWIALLLLVPSLAWQAARIFPYTPLARSEVALVRDIPDPAACFTALAFNVLQDNRDYPRALALLEREDPDIVLLLETDRGWAEALAPFLARYPHRLERPLPNTYGLLFATRLEMTAGEILELAEPDTPSVFATLKVPSGRAFQYIGLHPRPPVPGQHSHERDAEIAIAARHAARQPLPALAMGDFNDVAWSHTSHVFKRIGEYLDPRVGRGLYATFPAAIPFFRWPLDHLFVSRDFAVADVRVLEHVGSDHLPLAARLCLDPALARRANDPPDRPDASDREEAREMIEGRDGER